MLSRLEQKVGGRKWGGWRWFKETFLFAFPPGAVEERVVKGSVEVVVVVKGDYEGVTFFVMGNVGVSFSGRR